LPSDDIRNLGPTTAVMGSSEKLPNCTKIKITDAHKAGEAFEAKE